MTLSNIILEYFRKKLKAVGTFFEERAYYNPKIVDAMFLEGFVITHSFDGLVFTTRVERVA